MYESVFRDFQRESKRVIATFSTKDYVRRLMDIIVSIIGIILCLPIGLIIYLAIKVEDGGYVIYKQERIGYKGKSFTLYKFRSMIHNAEKDVPLLCVRDDNRLTRVGSFLRSHHLDELPQLWNVIKGDLSLVGPRPERKYFIELIMQYDYRYKILFSYRPGLFSYATLYNGYTDTIDKMLIRLKMDLEYGYRESLSKDIRIIFLSLWALISGKKF